MSFVGSEPGQLWILQHSTQYVCFSFDGKSLANYAMKLIEEKKRENAFHELFSAKSKVHQHPL